MATAFLFVSPQQHGLRYRNLTRRGSIATEYATVLGVIAVGAVLAISLAGEKVADTFQLAANMIRAGNATDSVSAGNGSLGGKEVSSDEPQMQSWTTTISVALAISLVAVPTLVWAILRRSIHRKNTDQPSWPALDSTQHAEAQARFIAKRQEILQSLTGDIDALLDSQIEVRHVMTSNLITALPSMLVHELATQMNQLEVRHMLVCSSKGQLLGIVSDRDVRGAKGETAAAIMTRDLVTVASASMLKPATTLMLNHHISSLPVVDDGRLVGILTLTDLVLALQCTMQALMPLAVELRSKTLSPREPQDGGFALEETVHRA